jgi:hypothetical protein
MLVYQANNGGTADFVFERPEENKANGSKESVNRHKLQN